MQISVLRIRLRMLSSDASLGSRKCPKIWSFLTPTDLHKVIQAFIFSRLSYCNALYAGIRAPFIDTNWCRTLVPELSGTKRYEHSMC